MIKKQIDLLGLASSTYDIIDNTIDSPAYFEITQMPDKLTAGKNIIKLRGSTNLLVDTEILIDIADAGNNAIYYEAQDYLGDDGSIIISAYVYDNASPGDGYICIVGTSNAGTVQWMRDITIAPNERNASEIIFLSGSIPKVSIRETQKAYLNQTYTQGRVATLTGSSEVRLISPATEKIALQSAKTVLGQTRKGSPLWGKTIAPNPIIVRNQSIARSTNLVTLQPNAQPIIEVTTGNFRFSSSMVGGSIEINTPIISTANGLVTGSFIYNSTITKVLNTTQVRVADTVNFRYNDVNIYNIQPSAFTCSFVASPTLVATQNTQSYVDIRFENLQPATGDIYKIRSYAKPLGSVGKYELINETILDEQNILIYTGSVDYDREVGIFDSSDIYQTYWKYKLYNTTTGDFEQTIYNEDGIDTGTTTLTTVTSSKLLNSIHIKPSGSTTFAYKDHLRLHVTQSYYNEYYQDGNYVVSFDAITIANSNIQPDTTPVETGKVPDGWIDVYMSGSAFIDPPPYGIDRIDDMSLGKYIGSAFMNNNERVDDYKLDVIADRDGNGTPIFVVRAGEWHLSDIRVNTDMRTGFSPTYQRIVTPVPTLAREAEQQFKFQYYDYEGNEADFTTDVFGVKFDGSNFYLEGKDNLLTGSLFIGTEVGKGLEQSGDDGGAIRSVGYVGFPSASAGSGSGFMIWSGSALESTNPSYYSGVGLELVNDSSSYFRYTTDPPALDIRTNTFYLGSDKAFLSGSGENIEISSSNFWVQPDGDVFAENVIIRNVAAVDSFVYKNLLINSGDDIFEEYTYSGKTYYRLNITGSSAGVFLRFQDAVPYPIGEINMTAVQGGTGLGGAYGAWCVLEPASGDVYLKAGVAVNGGPSYKNKINVDLSNGDWASKSFINAPTLSGTAYSDLYRIDTGDRAWMVRSYTDWKVQNSSAFNSGPVYFKYGITSGGSGGTSALTASWAENAITASYAISASHEIVYETSSSYAEAATSASYALTASYATNAGSSDAGSAQYVHNQAAASTTWTVNHNIGKQYLAVSVYDSSNNYIIPQQITATSSNTTTITFSAPQSGNAIVTIGTDANSYVHNQASAATTWTVSHGLDKQYLAVSVYDASNNYILPQQITATDTNTTTLTFSSLQSGNAVATIGRGTTAISKWTSGSGDMIYRDSNVQITGSLKISGSLIELYSPSGSDAIFHIRCSGSGDAILKLEADLGNAGTPGESDNPRIEFVQDGAMTQSAIYQGNNTLNIANSVVYGGMDFLTGTVNGYTNATSSLFIGSTGNMTARGNYSSSIVSTASFGTYLGDGSQLTGISSGGGFPFSGSAVITGSLIVSGSGTASYPGEYIITQRLQSYNNGDSSNFIAGANAGNKLTKWPNDNVVIGYLALDAQTGLNADSYNVVIGSNAASDINNTNSFFSNVLIGYAAGYKAGGGDNVAIGSEALRASAGSAVPSRSIAIGRKALEDIQNANGNIAIGYYVGESTMVHGDDNIFIGNYVNSSGYSGVDSTRQLKIGYQDIIPFSASLDTGDVVFPSSASFTGLPTSEPTITGSLWISGSSVAHPKSGYLMVFNP